MVYVKLTSLTRCVEVLTMGGAMDRVSLGRSLREFFDLPLL